jgi:glutaredoxin
MRRWIWVVALAGVFAYQKREAIQDWISPPPPIVVPAGFKAIMYATATCPYCAKARKLLNDRQVPFIEVDVDKSEAGFAEYERLGGQGVPVIVINQEVIHGFDRERIEQVLAEL